MFAKDMKLFLTDKRMWVMFACVLALICLFGLFGTGSKKAGAAVNIGIVDMEKSDYSQLLISFFEENEVFTSYVKVIRGTEADMDASFEAGELDMYLVIPENFTAELIKINNTPIRAVINISDKTKGILFKNLLEAYARYISSVEISCQTLFNIMTEDGWSRELTLSTNEDISYDLIFTALGKDSFFERNEIERFSGVSLVNYYACAGAVLIMMYGGLLAGLNLLYEKKNGIIDRLRTMGKSRAAIYFEKLAFYSLIYFVIAIISVIVIGVLADTSLGIKSILVMLIGIALSNLLFILLALCLSKPQSYLIAANMLILLFTISGGSIIPIMYLPQAIVRIARFTPNYWFIKTMLGLGEL